jgi:esterase/lipase superfamily enzyme
MPVRRGLFVLTLLLAACAQRAVLDVVPTAAPGIIAPVYVATMRALMPDGSFGSERSETLSYLSLDISVPPDRAPGQIAYRKGGKLDPEKHFFATARTDFSDLAQFRNRLSTALRRQDTGGEAIIFVHGFNNTFADGVYRIAQLTHDFDFQGVAVHYSWPSAGSALGYEYDRDSQLVSRDGLETLIDTVRDAGARRIIIVAHSMGSLLTMEALRQMEIAAPGAVRQRIKGVILMSPDIDVSVFRSQAKRIGTLPDPFAIFVSRRDRALFFSAFLSGQPQRLGNLVSAEELADLKVTVIDVTQFSQGLGHFTAGTSPVLIKLLSNAGQLDAAFRGEAAKHTGLLPGFIITVRSATELVLSPIKPLVR